jgi:hypothetical protein
LKSRSIDAILAKLGALPLVGWPIALILGSLEQITQISFRADIEGAIFWTWFFSHLVGIVLLIPAGSSLMFGSHSNQEAGALAFLALIAIVLSLMFLCIVVVVRMMPAG